MKPSTKERIIEVAMACFNRAGFGAVNLLEIAQELGMSRGNLVYHFPDKDALLAAISEQLWQEIQQEISARRQLPTFENMQKDVKAYYRLQQKYRFIFADTHVLNHPAVAKTMNQWSQQTIQANQAAIAFAIEIGNMRPEPYPGIYYNLALTTWILFYYWLPQQTVRGKDSGQNAEKAVWSLIVPHFTEKGILAFEKFFGKDFLHQLGDPFPQKLEKWVGF